MDLATEFASDARETLAQLATRLVALEHAPGDRAALDAVFRAVHTLKGGAGFLSLPSMVALCHALEDALDAARSGRVALTPAAFDDVQHAVDVLEAMVDALARGLDIGEAPAALLAALHALAAPAGDGLDDLDFDALLDSLHGAGGVPGALASPTLARPAPGLLSLAHASGEGRLRATGSRPDERRVGRNEDCGEEALAPGAPPPAASTDATVRVDATRLDALVDLVDELRLARSALRAVPACARDDALRAAAGAIDAVSARLQHAVLAARMQPVARVFARFPRLARDVARQLGKDVELVLDDGGVELDRTLVDALAEPLVHLVRNAIDHGIESPGARRAAGKPGIGRVHLRARAHGDACEIEIEDDGAGIDADALRASAVRKGLLDTAGAAALDDAAALQLVFAPGFSTREVVSDVSGRGVGMDAVRSAILALSGQVTLASTPGAGTRCTLRLPLTLAVMQSLLVESDGDRYALPLLKVVHVGDAASPPRAGTANARRVDLRAWLQREPASAGAFVLIETASGQRLLSVDRVLGREDTVLRALPPSLRGLAGYAGTTVSADGRMTLVLDVEAVAASAG